MKRIIFDYVNNKAVFLFPLIFLLFINTACNNGKKNDDDFVVKNGLIYLKNSKIPFTGRESAIVKGSKIEYDVLKGVKTGEFKIFYSNGNPQMVGHLLNNKNEGLWKYFYPDSTLESQGNFKNDLPDGKWSWYHNDGSLMETGNYISGKREGSWKDFDKDGKLVSEKLYKDGDEITSNSDNKAK